MSATSESAPMSGGGSTTGTGFPAGTDPSGADVPGSNTAAAPATGSTAVLDKPESRRTRPSGDAHPLRWAVAFVIPYLLIGFAWVFSNPPGAGPDEADHLVKALAAGNLEIGVKFAGPPPENTAPAIRNASISRTVSIPAHLAPDGYFCTAFNPNQTADCLPDPTNAPGMVERTATVGAYPVFWYVPIGFAALQGDTPEDAFHLARSASLVLSLIFLLLGVWHLTRWLGRAAGLGSRSRSPRWRSSRPRRCRPAASRSWPRSRVACVVVVMPRGSRRASPTHRRSPCWPARASA